MAHRRGDSIGRYRILSLLGMGGMAEVYLACTQGPGGFRKYAVIKRPLKTATDDFALALFLDEARVTASLNHPSLIQLFELSEDDQGPYVVMELVAGETLASLLEAASLKKERLPAGFCVSVAIDGLAALHHAHTLRGPTGDSTPVIHRDVALKNIMVSYEGIVKLVDFGVAHSAGAISKTKSGTTKGTTGYMSPEQVLGQPLDGRSDVFSMGVVLWELLAGKRLFEAPSEMAEMRLVLDAPAPRLGDAVPQLAEVVTRALERDVEQRWPTAQAFAKALRQAAGDGADAEARSKVMIGYFEQKRQAARALFGVPADDEVGLDSAVKRFEESSQSAVALPSRSLPRLAKVPNESQLVAETKKRIEVPRSSKRPMVLVMALAVSVAVVWRWFDSTTEQQTPSAKPIITTVPLQAASDSGFEKTERIRPRSDVMLVVLPSAKVFKGNHLLAEGSLMRFSLAEGTHSLTVTGDDAVKRRLVLTARGGGPLTLKLQLSEIPAQGP